MTERAMAAPLGRGSGLPPRTGAAGSAASSAAANNGKSSTSSSSSSSSSSYELVRMGPGGEGAALLHHLVRFDDGEDPFGKGQPPFFCYQEKEEIAPDEEEVEQQQQARGDRPQRPQRQPRASVRWTLEDAASVRSGSKGGADNGLLYHGKPLATAPGSAYVLMVPNRAAGGQVGGGAGGRGGGGGGNKKQIFVVPVGPWIGYHRVADAVDVPVSVKEAEALMKGGGAGGAGGKRGGRRKEGWWVGGWVDGWFDGETGDWWW
jgi:hypothetical protein